MTAAGATTGDGAVTDGVASAGGAATGEPTTAGGRVSGGLATAGPLLLGLDVGGTSTRVLVADGAGRVLATARGDGANPVSHGPELAAARITATLAAALADLDPAEVEAAVLGLAGGLATVGGGGEPPFLAGVWRAVGLRTTPRLVGDVELAYAAGTSRPDGSVLVAGTGAVAADCRDFTANRVADGHGWLLGDLGSGYWLGREAVRLVLALIDTGGDLGGGLAATVLAELGLPEPDFTEPDPIGAGPGGPGSTVDGLTGADSTKRTPPASVPSKPALPASVPFKPALPASVPFKPALPDPVLAKPVDLRGAVIRRVHAEAPVRLARLAPVVLAAAAAGDPAAVALVGRAADHLLETLATVRPAGSTRPVVLAGGVLSGASPLAEAVGARVAERWPGAEILPAGSGAGAAAWLAARDLRLPDAEALHGRLVR